MKPAETGRLYDAIAAWWDEQERSSSAGLHHVDKAIRLCRNRRKALDVGCGSGGRIVTALLNAGFDVTGIDVSETMIAAARKRHPGSNFLCADICEWQASGHYDIVIAWDSIFHVPYGSHRDVIRKLCGVLSDAGVLLFTAGGVDGEVTGQMCNQDFHYSSLDEREYVRILQHAACRHILTEWDQSPEKHVVFVATKDTRGEQAHTVVRGMEAKRGRGMDCAGQRRTQGQSHARLPLRH